MSTDAFDTELLSDEELEGSKSTPPIDEPEPTSDEPLVDTKVPSPPEGEKKVEEPPAKVEEPVIKPPVEPPPKVEPPPTIDGIIAKDGKNYIPFNVLEEERAAKKLAVEEKQRLESEIAELKKAKVEPVKELAPIKEPDKKIDAPPIDFKVIAKKAYESEDGMAEALQQMFEAGKVEASKAGATAGRTTTIETEFAREAARIKSANSWITPGLREDAVYNRALSIMQERKLASDDLAGMVKAAEDAVSEMKKEFRVDEPKIDLEAERKKMEAEITAKVTKDILAKFNIKESDAVTLADVRNASPNLLNKFDEIDKLIGIDYEEAIGQLSSEERQAFLRRGDNA